MTAPALLRIGSTSIGFVESNTSQTVSARRNNAAGVAVAKVNFRRRPSLSRWASTEAAPSPAFASGAGAGGGGSGAATAIFGSTSVAGVFTGTGASATGAAISFDGGTGAAISGAGDGFGADPGLISMLACSAKVSEVGGTIPPAFHNGEVSLAGFSAAEGAAAAGAAAIGAGACDASAAGNRTVDGFSVCWKPTSIM